MKRIYLLLLLAIFCCCKPDKVLEESCNNARVKNVTVIRDVRFGMPLSGVLNSINPDTFFILSFYPDTSVTFRSDFYAVPARYYMNFDKFGLSDLQIQTVYEIDSRVDEIWIDSISSIYGNPLKIKYKGKSNSFYWRWILCDGGRATLGSCHVFNAR